MSEGNPWLEAGTDSILLDDLTLAGRPSVLERLGPASFRSKGFSLIGFLQTLYDHVAEKTDSSATAAPVVAETDAPVQIESNESETIAETPATDDDDFKSKSPFDHSIGI